MPQKLLCHNCSRELLPEDKFCNSCGTPVTPSKKQTLSQGTSTATACKLCGNQNPPDAKYCESCGNVLHSQGEEKSGSVGPASSAGKHSQHTTTLNIFQSWKLTVFAALLLVTVLVIVNSRRNNEAVPVEEAVTPTNEAIVQQIETLQKNIDANPNDATLILQLANRLQDAKFLPRAITMYERYLKLNPSDVDAKVDLGVSYFELGLADTAHMVENLHSAQHIIEEAIKSSPKHQLAHFNLGIISLHTGNMKAANEWFKKTADIDSTTQVGRKAHVLLNQHAF